MVVGMAEARQVSDKPLHGEEEGRPHQDVLAELQCITELKEIKQKVTEPVWEFD
jgi:hypothetical protein